LVSPGMIRSLDIDSPDLYAVDGFELVLALMPVFGRSEKDITRPGVRTFAR
jgi:hypothetical protein